MRILLVLLFLSVYGFAAHSEEELDREANYCEDPITWSPLKIVPHVDPVSGTVMEEECDLVVAGVEPLSVRRFHYHHAPYEPRYGNWYYNPETYAVANLELEGHDQFVAFGNARGSICSFRTKGQTAVIDKVLEGSFFTKEITPHLAQDGKQHPENTTFKFKRMYQREFQYFGDIVEGDGTKKYFETPNHPWLSRHEVKAIRKTSKNGRVVDIETYQRPYMPAKWTPCQLPIIEERKPNGNIICYTYQKWKNEYVSPRFRLIDTITAYNSTKTKMLGQIKFNYDRDNDYVRGLNVKGSDKRKAGSASHGYPLLLHWAGPPDKPTTEYHHEGYLINRIERQDGRQMFIEYYPDTKKVKKLYQTLGPKGEFLPATSYIYHDGYTEVVDAENNKKHYVYDEHKRITAIKVFNKDQLYRVEKNLWSSNDLAEKTVEDGQGLILLKTSFVYDTRHNPIQETQSDGKESYTVYRKYSDDGFNLKLAEWDDFGKKVAWSYKPGTNLLTSELVCEGDKIRKRTFHDYDDCAVCIKTIIDDGFTQHSQDLNGVSYRKITVVQPKQTLPCFGLPEVVEEKTINGAGQEILLHKTRYTYHPSGKILQEEHFDASNKLQYTLLNEYDRWERLIAATDGLGRKKTFKYDANFNVTSISGPRADMCQHITYDFVNRPTKIYTQQCDGSFLIVEKSYDKLGNVISEKDASGFETKYRYDCLNRLVETYHPDGAIESKEYDVLGNVVKEKDALGYVTMKTYNFRKQPLLTSRPNDTCEAFMYSPDGHLLTHTDTNGATHVYKHDIFGNVLEIATGTLRTTKSTYTPFTQLSHTDGEGFTTHMRYDFAGRKIEEEVAGKKTCYEYDTLGRVARVISEGVSTVYGYDVANRVVEMRVEGAQLLEKESYKYDAADNKTEVINSKGIHKTVYNTMGQPIKIVDPIGNETLNEYIYNKGLTIKTTDALKRTSFVVQDCRGRIVDAYKKDVSGAIIQRSEMGYDHAGNTIFTKHYLFDGPTLLKTIVHTFEYGPQGQLCKLIEAGIKETQYIYHQGQLVTKIKPDQVQLHYAYDVLGRLQKYFSTDFSYEYQYDSCDRVICVRNGKYTTERSYDAHGNVLREKLENGLVTQNEYDCEGRRIQQTLPDGSLTQYGYVGEQLASVTRKGLTITYARDLEGNLSEITTPSGKIVIQRDALSRWKVVSAPHYEASYLYDTQGNIKKHEYTDSIGKEACEYSYDSLDQLIAEKNHSYCYDSLNNRLKKDNVVHEVDELCRLITDGTIEFKYDRNGNLLFDGENHYVYDSQDRLIRVNEKSMYEYDPFHRRMRKGDEVYLWDGNCEIGSYNNKKWTLRILGEGLGAEVGASVFCEIDDKVYTSIHDHRGSLVGLISEGNCENYRYTAFGEELTESKLSPWRFASKRVDEESGLIYFGRRYYMPTRGRWVTCDPEGFDDGPNLYAYVKNCPLVFVDATGLMRENSWTSIDNYLESSYEMAYFPSHSFLQKRGLCSDSFLGFENGLRNHSSSYNLKEFGYKDWNGGGVGFVNGMKTSFATGQGHAQYIGRLGNVNVHGVYNASHGFGMDLLESIINVRGTSTTPVRRIQESWNHFFSQADSKALYLQFCHSQGTAHVKNALRDYPTSLRSRIVIAAIAPSAYIPREYCHSVTHYVSTRDSVPYFDRAGKLRAGNTVQMLPRHPKANLWDHDFRSPTYMIPIFRELNKFKELIGTQ